MMRADELKFEFTMIDLFLVLKSNLGFILFQRLFITMSKVAMELRAWNFKLVTTLE